MIKIERKTSIYNQRRYSRPWIAQVDFGKNPNGEYRWGNWVGDHRNGSEGILIIEVNPGDIVATGQKDFRQPKNSAPDWWRVDETGNLVAIDGKADAYRISQEVAHA